LGSACEYRQDAVRANYGLRPEHTRRIRFKDPDTDKTLAFLTNNTMLTALTIAAAVEVISVETRLDAAYKAVMRISLAAR